MPGRRQDFQSKPNRHRVDSNASPRRVNPPVTSVSLRDLANLERRHHRHWREAGDQVAICKVAGVTWSSWPGRPTAPTGYNQR